MIGKKDKGLNAMFTMMNLERIVVGNSRFRNFRNCLSKFTCLCKREKTRQDKQN
jgi:hypothetical protein